MTTIVMGTDQHRGGWTRSRADTFSIVLTLHNPTPEVSKNVMGGACTYRRTLLILLYIALV